MIYFYTGCSFDVKGSIRKVLESILNTLVCPRLGLPNDRSGIYHIGMQVQVDCELARELILSHRWPKFNYCGKAYHMPTIGHRIY